MIGSSIVLIHPRATSASPSFTTATYMVGFVFSTVAVLTVLLILLAVIKVCRSTKPKARKLPELVPKPTLLSRFVDAFAMLGLISAIALAYTWHSGFLSYLFK